MLMKYVHAELSRQELGFAVLKCGSSLINFYKRVGYVKVSDHGMYIRDDTLEIDNDPALAISFRKSFNTGILNCEAFPFGFDF